MATIVSESFEGTGYENSTLWSESTNQDASSIVDEDNAGPGSLPTNGGSSCLRLYRASGEADEPWARLTLSSEANVCYARVYVYFPSSITIAEDNALPFFGLRTSYSGVNTTYVTISRSGSTYSLNAYYRRTGPVWSSAYTKSGISLNSWICVELYASDTNHAWAFRVNEESISSQTDYDADTGGINRINCIFTVADASTTYGNVYYDMLKLDNAAWVGQEVAAGGSAYPYHYWANLMRGQ